MKVNLEAKAKEVLKKYLKSDKELDQRLLSELIQKEL